MQDHVPYQISEKHAYFDIRRPPAGYPTKEVNGKKVPFGWSHYTVEFGPTNSLYLHVDVDGAGRPVSVEVLWADDKLTRGWRESFRVDLERNEVTLAEPGRAVTTLCPVIENVRGELGYDAEKKLVHMRFEEVMPGEPDHDSDRLSDPAFDAFLAAGDGSR
jgi:hypothetical protein